MIDTRHNSLMIASKICSLVKMKHVFNSFKNELVIRSIMTLEIKYLVEALAILFTFWLKQNECKLNKSDIKYEPDAV